METATLINNGLDQVIQLPRSFRFSGDKVYLKRMGNAVVLIPEEDSWQGLLDSIANLPDDFMADREQPANQDRPELFE